MLHKLLQRIFGKRGGYSDAPGTKLGCRTSVNALNERLLETLAPLKEPEPAADHARLGSASPSSAPSAATCAIPAEFAESFVCREPVLDRAGHMAGYEFMLRQSTKLKARHETPAVKRLHDEVLLRNVIDMGIDRLPGNRSAFIGAWPVTLDCRLLGMLPKKGVALVIRSSAALLENREEAYGHLKALRDGGCRIALEDFSDAPEMAPFFQLADYVVVDASSNDSQQLSRLANFFSLRYPDTQLIAKNVESMEAYEVCRKLQFHYFQGSFLTRLDELEQPNISANQIRLFELLNLIQQDADIAELVNEFKLDPMLTYKLLRYINSPGCGLVTKVTSIEHALSVLGQKKLYRWLTLFLFGCGLVNARDWALMESALVRGRMTEMLGREVFSPSEQDNLFIVGFFSLLDVLLRTPMGKALAQLHLAEDLVQALVHRQGKYAPYLELAIACEQFNQERIAVLADECRLDVRKVNVAQIESMLWALEVEK